MNAWRKLGLAVGRAWTRMRWFFGPARECWMYDHNLSAGVTAYAPWHAKHGAWQQCRRCGVELRMRDLSPSETERWEHERQRVEADI